MYSNRPRVSEGLSFRSYGVDKKSPGDLSLRLEMTNVLPNRGRLLLETENALLLFEARFSNLGCQISKT